MVNKTTVEFDPAKRDAVVAVLGTTGLKRGGVGAAGVVVGGGADGMKEEKVTLRSDVERVLADSRFEVPTAPAGDHGLAWLRSTASRFVNGAEHARRRALLEAELGRLDPEALRREARLRTDAVLDAAGGRIEAMADVARPIPLATLGSALGIGDGQLEGAVADAIVVGPAYLPGTADESVDAAEECGRS